MILSPEEIGALIYWEGNFGPRAYGSGETGVVPIAATVWLDTAIAIALAESGGNTAAKNGSSSATGLWQIMASVHTAKTAAVVKASGDAFKPEYQNLNNPVINTAVARQVYDAAGGKWTPWEVYNTGAYRSHTGHGAAAVKFIRARQSDSFRDKLRSTYYTDAYNERVPVGPPGEINGVVEATFDKVSDVGNWLPSVLDFAKKGAMTAGIFAVGLVVLILGIWFIVSNTKAGKAATKVATKGLV